MSKPLKINVDRMVYEQVENEVIIIDLESGNYFHVTGSGKEIWAMFVQQPTQDAILAALKRRYPTADLVGSVGTFLDNLKAAAIIVETDSAGEDIFAEVIPAQEDFQPPVLVTYTNMSDLLLLDPIHDVDERGWPHQNPAVE